MPNPNNLLTVIISHGGFPTSDKNHRPLWKTLGGKILTFFPKKSLTDNCPAAYSATPSMAYGQAEKFEPLSAERFHWLLSHLLTDTEAEYFLLMSVSTINLDSELPEKLFKQDVLWGAFPAPDEDSLVAGTIPSWPLFFSRKVATKLLEAINTAFGVKTKAKGENAAPAPITAITMAAELTIWSEMVGDLVAKKLVDAQTLGKLVFAREVIQPTDETAALMALRSVAQGGSGSIFLHGVYNYGENNRNVRMYQHAYLERNIPYEPRESGVKIFKNLKKTPKQVVGTPARQLQAR